MGCTTQAIAGGELIEVGVGLLESMDEITPGGRFSGFGRSPVSTAPILLYQNSQNPFPIKFLDILHPCGVAQLVRAPGSYPGSRWFESSLRNQTWVDRRNGVAPGCNSEVG